MLQRLLVLLGVKSQRVDKTNAPIKIALDQSIGHVRAQQLKKLGYEIVCRAVGSEPDEIWLKRALDAGALYIISPDLDIPCLIERLNYPMIWIDYLFADTSVTESQSQRRKIWTKYVDQRIQAKKKFLETKFGA